LPVALGGQQLIPDPLVVYTNNWSDPMDLGSAATCSCICKKLKMDTMSIDYYGIILYSDIIWLK
jgi:hypothetical protein